MPKLRKDPGVARMTDLNDILKSVRQDFGEESVMTFDPSTLQSIPRISTGILPLDLAVGGGWPKGRIVEIYGPESAGKTTVALKAIAAAQATGQGYCAFIDAEHALDPVYAQALGVDLKNCIVSQPDNGEQALDIVERLVRTGGVSLIVVDSVAALVPKAEIDGEMGEAHVGLHARLMSQAMRKLTSVVAQTDTIVIFLNQIREKVGVVYGSPEVTTGGRALKFYASIRVRVKKKQTLKDGDVSYANQTVVEVVKNKTYPPFKTAAFDIIFGQGPDDESAVIGFAVELGIMAKGGAWYTYGSQRFQGLQKTKEYFHTPEGAVEYEKVKQAVLAAYTGERAGELNFVGEED